MGSIFYIMGKSASGKDTIYQRLISDQEISARLGFDLHTIVLYTTRPIRQGEQEGVQYHFVTEEQYKEMERDGRILEQRTYDTVYGPWTYFTALDGQIDLNHWFYVMIGTLEGYQSIRDHFGPDRVVPIYIALDDGERLSRALARERQQAHPGYEELCRRFLADQKDFSNSKLTEAGITRFYVNDDLDACLENIVNTMKNQRNH